MRQHQRLPFIAALAALAATGLAGCSKPPQVQAASPAAASAAASPAANVSDIDVTEHVKTVLHQTESLKGANITVVTLNGDVRLTGVLDTQAQIDDALRIARAAEGSHAIHDELTLKN